MGECPELPQHPARLRYRLSVIGHEERRLDDSKILALAAAPGRTTWTSSPASLRAASLRAASLTGPV